MCHFQIMKGTISSETPLVLNWGVTDPLEWTYTLYIKWKICRFQPACIVWNYSRIFFIIIVFLKVYKVDDFFIWNTWYHNFLQNQFDKLYLYITYPRHWTGTCTSPLTLRSQLFHLWSVHSLLHSYPTIAIRYTQTKN